MSLTTASHRCTLGSLTLELTDACLVCLALAAGLKKLSVEKIAEAMQSSESNPMAGLEGRSQLLLRLGVALESAPEIFGQGATSRPGNMLGKFIMSKEIAVGAKLAVLALQITSRPRPPSIRL